MKQDDSERAESNVYMNKQLRLQTELDHQHLHSQVIQIYSAFLNNYKYISLIKIFTKLDLQPFVKRIKKPIEARKSTKYRKNDSRTPKFNKSNI